MVKERIIYAYSGRSEEGRELRDGKEREDGIVGQLKL